MKYLQILHTDLVIVLLIFAANFLIQQYNIGKLVYTFTDEGVYLYSAKLLNQGLLPYKDFFLAQPFYLLYAVAFILRLTNFDLNIFHLIYIIWVFSAIFPIYFIILKLTKSRLASILGIILFSTFTEFVQWDSHFFAFRQASQTFLAFGLFFLIVKYKPKVAGFILGIFAITLLQNLLLALSLIVAILSFNYLYKMISFIAILKSYTNFVLPLLLISFIGYIVIALLPYGFENTIIFQKDRPFLPYTTRIEWLKTYTLANNLPILIFGLLGSLFLVKSKEGWLGLFNILAIIIAVFSGSFYYPHYTTILAVGFSISSGFLFANLGRLNFIKVLITILVLGSIYISSYKELKQHLIVNKSPEFFTTISFLKKTPAPLFTLEPIYALYAQKDIVFHYQIADMRSLKILNHNLKTSEYLVLLSQSNTILLEPSARTMLSKIPLSYIDSNFEIVYSNSIEQIYVRKASR